MTNNKRKAFVAMPFRNQYDSILQVVRKAIADRGLDMVKIDEMSFTGSIVEKMRSEISESDLVIAIVSEENGNVYYEIGLAHCQNIPVVLLTDDPGKLKFDLKDHRAVIYDAKNPDAVFKDLVKMLQVTLDTDFRYPHDYFADVYGRRPEAATELGRKKVVETLKEDANLQDPVEIKDWQVLPSGELAVTVCDYLGTTVRAVFDRNGYLKRSRKD